MANKKICSANEAPPAGTVSEILIDGTPYAVCNVDGKLYCVDGTCPHAGGPLGQGTLHGNRLTCPWHAYEFDCRTGLNDADEDLAISTYALTFEQGDILADLP
jgi:nitrite reductase/ring-hydroxylating ferredoxin subunit